MPYDNGLLVQEFHVMEEEAWELIKEFSKRHLVKKIEVIAREDKSFFITFFHEGTVVKC